MTLELTLESQKSFNDFAQLNADADFHFSAQDSASEFRTFLFDCDDENDADALESALSCALTDRGFDGFSFASN